MEVSLLNILRTVILALSFAVIAVPAFAQLSPGDLAEAHEELEGLTNCTECHELGEGPSNDKCLACHTALRRTMESARGYHSLQTKDQACVTCHKDHAGTDFKLITWPHGGRDKFDHTLAGYDLRGAHIKTPCRDCHNPVHHRKDLIGEESSIDPTQTFLGLDRNCLGCHRDEHRAQLGADCLKCHDPAGFKPAGQFDHSSAHFGLTGKHRQTECSKCHELLIDESASRGDTTFTKYKDIPFDGCSKCHKDKHEDKYGSRCDQCHRTSGWKNIVASATTVMVIANDGTLADTQVVDIIIDFTNAAPQIDSPGDTVHHARLTYFAYYPQFSDVDDSVHEISYLSWPHWCDTSSVNDSVVGVAPDSVFFELLTVVVRDVCHADTLSFMVHVYLCGDVNNDGGQTLDISDLVYLVDYMFVGGPAPPVIEAGDCDGSGGIDIADLVYLVDYMFNGGSPPVCPE